MASPTTGFTPVEEVEGIVSRLRDDFEKGKLRGLEGRVKMLKRMRDMLCENVEGIERAIEKDLGRAGVEASAADVMLVQEDIETHLGSLKTWTADEAVSPGRWVLFYKDSARVRKEPKGVVTVIGPWNVPVALVLQPAVAAIAAGNCVVLKPSEVSWHTGSLLAQLIRTYFSECVGVVYGGVKETRALLDQPVDHIFYTGNPKVGRVVMEAAAKNLTPVTLELGGKNPVVIGDDVADLNVVAKRIMHAKLMNSGQICVAPDYILIHHTRLASLIQALDVSITQIYGGTPRGHSGYGKIINAHHHSRLTALLSSPDLRTLTLGPDKTPDRSSLYFPPTLIINPPFTAPCMTDEIFGPILPILTVRDTFRDTIPIILKNKNPLAMYIFSDNQTFIDHVLNHCNSGGVTINDAFYHLLAPNLPFGGIGNSGMGSYHGRYGISTFQHQRAILHRWSGFECLNVLRYPSMSGWERAIMEWVVGMGVKGGGLWGWGRGEGK